MTPAERHALTFVAFLLLLGVGVRVVRARADEVRPTQGERAALAAQIAAVDSVREAARAARAEGRKKRSSKKDSPTVGAKRSGKQATRDPADVSHLPPLRPIPEPARSFRRAQRTESRIPDPESRPSPRTPNPDFPVDLDLADATALERLPGIGPALAARIVADREALGPYGSLAALQRVRGIGPATARRLAPHVTFSHRPRHLRVEDPGLFHPLDGGGTPGVRPPAP